MENSLFEPLIELAARILLFTTYCGPGFFKAVNDRFWEQKNAKIYFCGFSVILVPLVVALWIIFLGIWLAEVLIFIALGLLFALLFVCIGVWPALLTSLGIAGITIIRLPWMIYSHCLVTYRTAMLRPHVKLISFLLMPLVHLLIPPATFLRCLLLHLVWFSSVSFVGYPLRPWRKIPEVLEGFWKTYVTDMEVSFQEFGHPSGIPRDWDGRVFGLSVDLTKIITNVVLYLIATPPISLGTFVIFSVKAVPIFLATLLEAWKLMKNVRPLQWLVEYYVKIEIFKVSGEKVKRHWKRVDKLDPHKLENIVKGYLKDFSPVKLIPEDVGAAWVILWLPALLIATLWFLALVLVIAIPSLTFLLGLVLWLVAWLPIIVLPTLLYLIGWIFILFGLPALYLPFGVIVLLGPWLFVAVGMLSGPVLSLKILFGGLSKNFFNPAEMWSGIKKGFRQIPQILIRVDKFTGGLSLGKFRFSNMEPDPTPERRNRVGIDYWDLYIKACKGEACRICNEGWLSEEDIQAASSTALIAIPGSAILTILERSIKKNKKDRTLILWNADTECREATMRSLDDNVANVFWPQIMQIKEELLVLNNLEVATRWIRASLCDGEDEKSEELARTLEESKMGDEEQSKWCLEIRSRIENTVHSLLRVKDFNSRLSEILDTNTCEKQSSSS